ncbi:MAG: hypothetical protein K2I81_03650 [Alphaproteobacteria bacterium]|nr:hypothetical protein [Alphaproteobacteria bacterium]
MKTKIIYISGSEVFEMSDVRAAFEEVRNTLGLGRDTVLFGVPVDNDDALTATQNAEKTEAVADAAPIIANTTTEIISEEVPSPIIEEINIPEEVEEEIITVEEPVAEISPIIEEAPAPVKKSRGRPRKSVIQPAPVQEEATPAAIAKPEDITAAPSEKVIPILSVLAANAPVVQEPVAEETVPAETADEQAPEITEEETEIPDVEEKIETVSIDDMIADDAPEAPLEKTLEQLLESMTPLREDHGENANASTDDDMEPVISIADDEITTVGDTDATLEQLAAEFASNEDKIAAPAPMSQGKIGKLKNILPFKKARREDTGLMGDLFGWAGVAANDEDFTIPGFFSTAASKK